MELNEDEERQQQLHQLLLVALSLFKLLLKEASEAYLQTPLSRRIADTPSVEALRGQTLRRLL
jgi:hypothetical protein